ncbi:MAG: metallopeptidase TldD-related protein [Clostridia bacterium]|nr:metallopeptidase TldD-related protein [Clostridia bacterium]
MIELVKNILTETEDVSAYEIVKSHNDERQLYYVGKKLETNRAVSTQNITVRVYSDFDEKRGSSSFTIIASDDEASIRDKAKETVNKAKAAGNKWYPLPEKSGNINTSFKPENDLNTIALSVADAIFEADDFDGGQLNATEIFVSLKHHTFVNSNGVEHEYDTLSAEFETIPSYDAGEEKVELYDFCILKDTDPEKIKAHIREELKYAKMRAEAKRVQELDIPENIPVVISGEGVATILHELADDSSYRNVYQHMNHFELGSKVSESSFTMKMTGGNNDGFPSGPIDGSGIVKKSRTVIENSVITSLWGDMRFGYYMGEKDVTGELKCIEIEAEGTDSFLEEPHIEVCKFSAPQIEWDAGYFGGEVRLALYFDGENYTPVSGFSISGNVYDLLNGVVFSKEKGEYNSKYSGCVGPKYWKLTGMTIN